MRCMYMNDSCVGCPDYDRCNEDTRLEKLRQDNGGMQYNGE